MGYFGNNFHIYLDIETFVTLLDFFFPLLNFSFLSPDNWLCISKCVPDKNIQSAMISVRIMSLR